MAGLPCAGKSAVAEKIATELRCALLSVDPIEAAMWRAGISRDQPTGLAAYVVPEDLAREQLKIGSDVVVDTVNDVEAARMQWKQLASDCNKPLAFIEVFCSDEVEHQRRLATRQRRIKGFFEPSWNRVAARRSGFDDWDDNRARVDSINALQQNIAFVLDYLEIARGRSGSLGVARTERS